MEVAIPKIKDVRTNDVFQVMFSNNGAGQGLLCKVKSINKDENNNPVVVFEIMEENSGSERCFVGGTSIYKTAKGRHKNGIFTVNTDQWSGFKWRGRVCSYTSEKLYLAHKIAAAGKIKEAALTLDSKEEVIEFLLGYIQEGE